MYVCTSRSEPHCSIAAVPGALSIVASFCGSFAAKNEKCAAPFVVPRRHSSADVYQYTVVYGPQSPTVSFFGRCISVFGLDGVT